MLRDRGLGTAVEPVADGARCRVGRQRDRAAAGWRPGRAGGGVRIAAGLDRDGVHVVPEAPGRHRAEFRRKMYADSRMHDTRTYQAYVHAKTGNGGRTDDSSPASRGRRADRLLGLLSSSVRIEPGLLRAVRRALPPGEADAGTEADVWQHRDIASRHPVAATPHREAIQRTSSIGQEADALVQEALRHRHHWRQGLPREIWFLEVIGLPAAVRRYLPHPEDFETACRFFAVLHNDPSRVIDDLQAVESWLDEVRALATPEAWDVTAFREAVGPVALRDRRFVPPASVDPGSIEVRPDEGGDPFPAQQLLLELRQLGRDLTLSSRDDQEPGAGSLMGVLRSGNGLLSVSVTDDGKPAWADDWDEDAHGAWASFSVVGRDGARITQRLRWCPPGRFQMGSPETEEGRYPDEGPRHEVAIGEGFWMFDTACTEALWQAVTDRTPDPRRGAEFPVTNVSWTDAQSFVRQLNAAKPGLDLSLPSEAQWEYACRAGTDTPYNCGTKISGDLICYASRAPVAVGSLPPNGWGLFEMHGNVFEWCADHWHDSYDGAPANGSAWMAARGAAPRVVRGGSWYDGARDVRAASATAAPRRTAVAASAFAAPEFR